jgi:hypothetical protein
MLVIYLQHLRHFARHWMALINHFVNQADAYFVTHPYVLLAASTALIVIWLWLAGLVGRKSAGKGQSFWYGFFLSIFAGPVIGGLFAASLRPAASGRRASAGRKKVLVSRERVA